MWYLSIIQYHLRNTFCDLIKMFSSITCCRYLNLAGVQMSYVSQHLVSEIYLHVLIQRDLTAILSSFFPFIEEKQKKKKQQKEKSTREGKTSLQRSKTFVNLFFKKDRKGKSRSKSPSHQADKGGCTVTGHLFSSQAQIMHPKQ